MFLYTRRNRNENTPRWPRGEKWGRNQADVPSGLREQSVAIRQPFGLICEPEPCHVRQTSKALRNRVRMESVSVPAAGW